MPRKMRSAGREGLDQGSGYRGSGSAAGDAECGCQSQTAAGQAFPQQVAAAKQPAAHGARRPAQLRRRLLIRLAVPYRTLIAFLPN